MTNQIFLAYDGDNAGRLVGRSILANDPAGLSEVSQRINLGHEVVKKWVEEHGGNFISGGGDEGIFSLPAESVQDIEELRRDYEFATNLTMSVGVGQDLSQAGKSLLVAKTRGKNQVVLYDQSVESDIQATQERVSQGQGSEEEQKLGEAYLGTGDKDQKNFQQDSWQQDQIKKEKTGQTPSQLATESPEQKAQREKADGNSATSEVPPQEGKDSALSQESPQDATKKVNSEASAKVNKEKPASDQRPGEADKKNRVVPPQSGDLTSGLPPKHKEKDKEEEIGQSNKHVIGKEMSTPREKAESTGKDPKDEVKKIEKKENINMKPQEKPQNAAPPNAAPQASADPASEIAELKARLAALEQQVSGAPSAPGDPSVPGKPAAPGQNPAQQPSPAQAQQTIKQNIAQPSGDQQAESQQMDNIDAGAMPVSNEMEGNVSRPDGFRQQNVPGDTGTVPSPEGGVEQNQENPGDTQDDMMGVNSPTDQAQDQGQAPAPGAAPAPGEEAPGAEQVPGEEGIPAEEGAPGEEENPEMAGVMQDGLDASADDEQANNVKQMIGQALDGFKNNKQILEQAKQQNPELYSSCIAMLKAMIEMAHMLGIADGSEEIPGEGAPGQEEAPCPTCGQAKAKQEDGQPPGEQPPGKEGFTKEKGSKESFPKKEDGKEAKPEGKGGFPPKKDDKKDDKSAAPKEGAANEPPKGKSPSNKGGLGKLPTKATTEHVPRTPLTEGSVNLKGQQKTIDKKTGKTRWIDRKKGVVMGPSGVPVKAAAQEQQ